MDFSAERILCRVNAKVDGPNGPIHGNAKILLKDLAPLRLLLIEDSESDGFLVLRALRTAGYDVKHRRVCTSKELSSALDNGEWDAIVSDYALPGFSGPAALAMVKARSLDIPFIIVSGTVGDEDAVAAMRAGAHDYLMKDRLVRLAPTIERELREAQNRRAGRAAESAAEEAQRRQAHAESANRAKTMFLANVSHELRTPLNAIIGFSELLTYEGSELGQSLSTQQREYIQHVLASGRHLLMLIDDLLDLSKVEAGKMELVLASIALADVTDLVMEVVGPLAEKKGLRLVISVTRDLPRLWADALRLRQILYNLLSNAIKFTTSGGTVSLDAIALEPRAIQITVRDSGIGIREDDMPRLFQEFERVGAPDSSEGTGLGLALTKKLVELHGGSIAATSSHGVGSTFTVVLPLRAVPTQEANLKVSAPTSARLIAASVLVVEDDGPSRRLARDVLKQRGYDVVEARDVDEALAIMRKKPPEIVITEIRIPGGGGEHLLREMRADPSLRTIPVVATGSDTGSNDLPFDESMSKPIDTQRLGQLVDRLVLKK
jgi:signal transduction histidine kinase